MPLKYNAYFPENFLEQHFLLLFLLVCLSLSQPDVSKYIYRLLLNVLDVDDSVEYKAWISSVSVIVIPWQAIHFKLKCEAGNVM